MPESITEEHCWESINDRTPLRIAGPYLLVVEQQLPFFRDKTGKVFVNDLWHKDLMMHLSYIDHLMIAAPCRFQEPPPDAKPLPATAATLEIIELPPQKGFWHSLRVMPTIVLRLSRAIRKAGIVHSAIAGWPIPMGWVVTPLALLFRKPIVIVVESAPWRLQRGDRAGWRTRARAALQEFLGRSVLRNAALVICTQDEYCQSMLGPNQTHGFVIPASWIDEKNILPEFVAEELWQEKLSVSESRIRLLFVGRLVPAKGILILLEAMQQLSAEGIPIALDILGEGPLKGQCEFVASALRSLTTVTLLGTVPYGVPLFELIRGYDAVVVPNISDEQPRIVFDAYSQAVPILASDTPGLRSCVKSGELGLFAGSNDVSGLAALLRYAAGHRSELRRLGLQSLAYAYRMTHQEMHRQRATLLQAMMDKRKEKGGRPDRRSPRA
jgi:glycosyltransferase involved in cell wall biosynthesis